MKYIKARVPEGMYSPDIIGSSDFFTMVMDAVKNRQKLSVVRMSDGEKAILDHCKGRAESEKMNAFDSGWRVRFGCAGIECGEMLRRMNYAQKESTYFAPDGAVDFLFDHYKPRDPFVEIYFHRRWTLDQKQELLKAAQCVLVANRDPAVARYIESKVDGVSVFWVPLNDWRDSELMISLASKSVSPLVLLSAGPANKHLAPAMAEAGIPKVVLDVGSGAAEWWTP